MAYHSEMPDLYLLKPMSKLVLNILRYLDQVLLTQCSSFSSKPSSLSSFPPFLYRLKSQFICLFPNLTLRYYSLVGLEQIFTIRVQSRLQALQVFSTPAYPYSFTKRFLNLVQVSTISLEVWEIQLCGCGTLSGRLAEGSDFLRYMKEYSCLNLNLSTRKADSIYNISWGVTWLVCSKMMFFWRWFLRHRRQYSFTLCLQVYAVSLITAYYPYTDSKEQRCRSFCVAEWMYTFILGSLFWMNQRLSIAKIGSFLGYSACFFQVLSSKTLYSLRNYEQQAQDITQNLEQLMKGLILFIIRSLLVQKSPTKRMRLKLRSNFMSFCAKVVRLTQRRLRIRCWCWQFGYNTTNQWFLRMRLQREVVRGLNISILGYSSTSSWKKVLRPCGNELPFKQLPIQLLSIIHSAIIYHSITYAETNIAQHSITYR